MKFTFCILAIAISLSLPFNGYSQEKIKIGVSAPLSGEAAVFGEDIRDVLTFAQNYFKDEQIVLSVQDDECSGKAGASVAQYFIREKVAAVLGYACVESIMPAIPILQKAKTPLISVLASGPDITGPGKNVFNLYPSDEEGVAVILQRLKELRLHKVLVLTASSAFPLGISAAFKNLNQKNSTLNVTYIDYPALTSDFLSILSKASMNNFEAIFINYSSVSEFISFMRQSNQLKLQSKILSSYLNGFDTIKSEGAIQLVNGVEFYDTAPIEQILEPNDQKIFNQYIAKYGHLKSSDGYFPFIFNGYVALRTALQNHAPISSALYASTFSNGIGPAFNFNSNGNIKGGVPFVLKKVINGELVTCPCS